MDKFELTPEEIDPYLYRVSTSPLAFAFGKEDGTLVSPLTYSHVRVKELLQAQVTKVKSFYEPVELEALGDEEMKLAITNNLGLLDNPDRAVELLFEVSQATISKNQKVQLFRLKEEKG